MGSLTTSSRAILIVNKYYTIALFVNNKILSKQHLKRMFGVVRVWCAGTEKQTKPRFFASVFPPP